MDSGIVIEEYIAMKKNKLLINATTWMISLIECGVEKVKYQRLHMNDYIYEKF